MSGRRVYQRFREIAPLDGQMRISRDVVVQLDETATGIAVLSDAPGVVGEELTLALVSSGGETELQVRVASSRPQIVEGAMRHCVRLEILSATPRPRRSERG